MCITVEVAVVVLAVASTVAAASVADRSSVLPWRIGCMRGSGRFVLDRPYRLIGVAVEDFAGHCPGAY